MKQITKEQLKTFCNQEILNYNKRVFTSEYVVSTIKVLDKSEDEPLNYRMFGIFATCACLACSKYKDSTKKDIEELHDFFCRLQRFIIENGKEIPDGKEN